jgi:voltage-gated potassium channel
VTTHWDLIQFATLTFVFMGIPLDFVLPHEPTFFELWIDSILTPLYAWDYFRAYRKKSPEALGTRNLYFQWLSILPLQQLFHLAGLQIPGMQLLIGFRLLRIPLMYVRLKERAQEQMVTRWLKIGAILYIGMIVAHVLACAWILISGTKEDSNFATYVKSLYFVFTTLSTVGYGDITPSSTFGRIFTMATQVIGVGSYGLIIGQVSSMIVESDKRTEVSREKLQTLTSLLKFYNIPPELQDQSFQIYKHMLSRQVSEDEQKVLQELPKGLQVELQIYMNMKPLTNVSLFKGVSEPCLKDIAKHLEQVYFSPTDSIIRRGEIGHEMYVIGHGSVDVHAGPVHIANLNDGQCFGEMALIADEERKADVTATSYCDLFKLTKENFSGLLERHADLRDQVNRVAEARRQQNHLRNSRPPEKLDAKAG